MKKFFLISAAALMISVSGCVNTVKQNQSQDDEWIQHQVEQGHTIPAVLR